MEGQYIPEGALGKVWRVLDRCIMFTTVVGSLASVMFIGAMVLNVIMRYVFSSPIWWFDEMIIALLVWYSALGTVVCYWTNEHAVIHFFLKFINRTGKLFFMFIPHVVVAITSLVFVSGGITLFGLQVTKLPQGGLPFTKAYYYALPMIVMGAMMTICAVYRIVEYILTPKHVFLDRFQKLQDEGVMIVE